MRLLSSEEHPHVNQPVPLFDPDTAMINFYLLQLHVFLEKVFGRFQACSFSICFNFPVDINAYSDWRLAKRNTLTIASLA